MIYLDNAATTKVCKEAIEACHHAMECQFGNAASLHSFGLQSEKLINYAKEQIASLLRCSSEEILFTSGATESNNTAIYGLAENYARRKKRIVTTAVEHPSVMEPILRLKDRGYDVHIIMPQNGEITADMIIDAVDDNTCLLSCMSVNNEIGYRFPLDKVFHEVKSFYPDCMIHCDAVQSIGKLPIWVKHFKADCISFSGHKFHAPKGVGGLYIRKGVRVAPLLLGGGQQKGLRSGTENVPSVYAMGKAVETILPAMEERFTKVYNINLYTREKLAKLDKMIINSPESGSPYILSICVPGYKSETILHYLEQSEIYVSSGSACSRGKKSSVLKAFGLSDGEADSTIRLSFSPEITEGDIDIFVDKLIEATQKLARAK